MKKKLAGVALDKNFQAFIMYVMSPHFNYTRTALI